MGYDMEEVVNSEGEVNEMTTNQTLETGAIPKDEQIMNENVVGIVNATVTWTKWGRSRSSPERTTALSTAGLIRRDSGEMIDDDRKDIDNEVRVVEKGDREQLSRQMTLEFAHVNHSIPDATLSLVDTPEGYVVYGMI